MTCVIEARNLGKTYRNAKALDGANFRIEPGRIVGLIGPNGAGKTTALKAVLGLIAFEGELSVLGHNPRRARCEAFLKDTKLTANQRVREMSKGMIVQLHLALVMAIDARLLVLDEPTLGLDILHRKQFYQRLLEDYFDADKTILITTHQVEEVEHILTDALFIRDGKIVLDASMETLGGRFVEVLVDAAQLEAARALGPIHARALPFGKHVLLFDGVPRGELTGLGETRIPGLADIFVATMQPEGAAA